MTKALDVKTMTRLVGDKLLEIFDVDSALIMLLDRKTNLIHVPYEYDKNEGGYIDYVEPFSLGTGLSSRVITTRQPLLAETIEEEIALGAYFPPEIIEKGSGFQPVLAGRTDHRSAKCWEWSLSATVRSFSQNHMRLLQHWHLTWVQRSRTCASSGETQRNAELPSSTACRMRWSPRSTSCLRIDR
jgi:hypothetical protein